MKIPHIKFSYNEKKDIENINVGLGIVRNGRELKDREEKQIIKKYGDNPTDEELSSYLKSYWSGKEKIRDLILRQLEEYWSSIEKIYFNQLVDKMQLESFYDVRLINGFLSTEYGCSYNENDKWFAISSHNGTLENTRIIMHEVSHIFFDKGWWKFCEEQGVPQNNIWDIKESVTVLLNLWFKDRLVDLDWGYVEHAELRRLIIREWFPQTNNFKDTLLKACEFMKLHPEKSPSWNK